MSAHIVLIPGDGIGEEIVAASLEVIKTVAGKININLTYETKFAGGAAIDKFGLPLPEDTIAACKKAQATLLGAVGGPKWDNIEPALRAEKAILGLRKELGLYANLRPIKIFATLINRSVLKEEIIKNVDFVIVRELTGGIYFGPKNEAMEVNGIIEASDLEIYHQYEIDRILKTAFETARKRSKKKVTSVDKANVLATSRLWRKRADELVKQYPGVTLEHMYVDNCSMQIILDPANFDVIVTSNMFGDILSDEASAITGSIGLSPSASLGGGPGLYEPIHGSAPDITGLGIANPLGTILSVAMMFRYSLKNEQAAEMIEKAVDETLLDGYRTADLYSPGLTKVSTEEMGRLVSQRI